MAFRLRKPRRTETIPPSAGEDRELPGEEAVLHPDPGRRLAAVREVPEPPGPSGLDLLEKALSDPDPAVAREAFHRLGRLGETGTGIILSHPEGLLPEWGTELARFAEAAGTGWIPAFVRSVPSLDGAITGPLETVIARFGPGTIGTLVGSIGPDESPERAAAVLACISRMGREGYDALAGMAVQEDDGSARETAYRLLKESGTGAVPSVIRVLPSAGEEDRDRLTGFLAGYGPLSVMPLAGLLTDDREQVRMTAALALVRCGKAAVPPLAALLAETGVQARMAQAILIRLGPAAVPALIGALHADEELKRRNTSECLVRIGQTAIPALAATLWSDDRRAAEEASRCLAQIGPAALPVLISSLRHEGEEGRDLCASVILAYGEDSVPLLSAALRDPGEQVRNTSLYILLQIGEPAVPALVRLLHDPEPDIRSRAAVALSHMGPPAVGPLIALLGDPEREVRNTSVITLARMGTAAVPALIETARTFKGEQGESARRALVMIGEPALPHLLEAAGTGDEGLMQALSAVTSGMGRKGRDALLGAVSSSPRRKRQVIASVLRQSADVSHDPVHKATLFFAMEDWERLVIHGAPALPVLIPAFADDDEEIRKHACDAVVAIGEPAVPLLLPLLGDEDVHTREGAQTALMRLATVSTYPLVSLLSGGAPSLATGAETVLAAIGEPAIGPLLALAPSAGPGVIAAVTRVLGSMGAPGIDPLISLLDDPDHGVYAVRALAGMGEAAFPKLVLTVTGGGETASRHAALALSRSGTAAVPVLVTALGTATGESQDRVSRALATGGTEYLPGIVSWLKEHPDDEVRSGDLVLVVMEVVGDDRERQLSLLGSGCPILIAASSTVLATRGEEVVPDLMGLLGSDDQLARAGALSTLGAIGPPAVPALAAAVSDPVTPTGIRTGALAALGTIPGEESMKGIVGAVSDRDVAVRRAAVRAMPATGPAAPFLARSLRDNDEEVRQMAAERLGGLGRPGIVPLTNALEDRDPGIRKAAVAGLAALGMPARYLLSRALHDPDTGVRLKAARAFREAGMTPEYSYDAFSYRSLLAGEKDLPVRG